MGGRWRKYKVHTDSKYQTGENLGLGELIKVFVDVFDFDTTHTMTSFQVFPLLTDQLKCL